jgi:sorbitol-specific phosphotransferase system component IIA
MLIIREEQMSALSQAMLKQFEDRMVVHLSNNFPDETREISEVELRALIQEGIEQAEQYQITLEDDVRRYLEFMVMYGHKFETNHDTAWAGEILYSKELDGTAKMDLIDERELEMVRGLI